MAVKSAYFALNLSMMIDSSTWGHAAKVKIIHIESNIRHK